MIRITRLSTSLAAVLVLLLSAPAQATNVFTYVSSTGSNTNSCFTTASACADFQAAHDATTPGGTITCVDNVFSVGATITKTITIDCAGTSSVAVQFGINASGIQVTIHNLTISGGAGIQFFNGASLIVENCFITQSVSSGIGFAPATAGAQLVVTDSTVSSNHSNNGTSGGGIIVNPQAGGSAVISLDHVTVANNAFGIVADGSRSTAGINMTIANSMVHRNTQDGIVATTIAGQAPIGLTVKNTRSLSNNIGIRATGPGVTVRADSASVSGNGTGLVVNDGAALLSYGNNNVDANGVDGAFSGPVTLK